MSVVREEGIEEWRMWRRISVGRVEESEGDMVA